MISADELFRALMAGIGYLEGNLVHAYSAAFHRLPRLREQLDDDAFLCSDEVREVTAAVIQLLLARDSSPDSRETALCQVLASYQDHWSR